MSLYRAVGLALARKRRSEAAKRGRNSKARKAVEAWPGAIEARSDNIALLLPYAAGLRAFLKG